MSKGTSNNFTKKMLYLVHYCPAYETLPNLIIPTKPLYVSHFFFFYCLVLWQEVTGIIFCLNYSFESIWLSMSPTENSIVKP